MGKSKKERKAEILRRLDSVGNMQSQAAYRADKAARKKALVDRLNKLQMTQDPTANVKIGGGSHLPSLELSRESQACVGVSKRLKKQKVMQQLARQVEAMNVTSGGPSPPTSGRQTSNPRHQATGNTTTLAALQQGDDRETRRAYRLKRKREIQQRLEQLQHQADDQLVETRNWTDSANNAPIDIAEHHTESQHVEEKLSRLQRKKKVIQKLKNDLETDTFKVTAPDKMEKAAKKRALVQQLQAEYMEEHERVVSKAEEYFKQHKQALLEQDLAEEKCLAADTGDQEVVAYVENLPQALTKRQRKQLIMDKLKADVALQDQVIGGLQSNSDKVDDSQLKQLTEKKKRKLEIMERVKKQMDEHDEKLQKRHRQYQDDYMERMAAVGKHLQQATQNLDKSSSGREQLIDILKEHLVSPAFYDGADQSDSSDDELDDYVVHVTMAHRPQQLISAPQEMTESPTERRRPLPLGSAMDPMEELDEAYSRRRPVKAPHQPGELDEPSPIRHQPLERQATPEPMEELEDPYARRRPVAPDSGPAALDEEDGHEMRRKPAPQPAMPEEDDDFHATRRRPVQHASAVPEMLTKADRKALKKKELASQKNVFMTRIENEIKRQEELLVTGSANTGISEDLKEFLEQQAILQGVLQKKRERRVSIARKKFVGHPHYDAWMEWCAEFELSGVDPEDPHLGLDAFVIQMEKQKSKNNGVHSLNTNVVVSGPDSEPTSKASTVIPVRQANELELLHQEAVDLQAEEEQDFLMISLQAPSGMFSPEEDEDEMLAKIEKEIEELEREHYNTLSVKKATPEPLACLDENSRPSSRSKSREGRPGKSPKRPKSKDGSRSRSRSRKGDSEEGGKKRSGSRRSQVMVMAAEPHTEPAMASLEQEREQGLKRLSGTNGLAPLTLTPSKTLRPSGDFSGSTLPPIGLHHPTTSPALRSTETPSNLFAKDVWMKEAR